MAGSKERWVLAVRGGPMTELPRAGVLTVGSSERANWKLEGAGVADVHCAIGRLKGGGWAIKDLGSGAGTQVNGASVQSKRLELGDVIALGSLELSVADASAPTSSAPPAASTASGAAPKRRAPSSGGEPAPKARAERSEPSGVQIAGYRVERPLGRGGMGEVFLAVQESLDRRVALKLLSRKLTDDAEFVSKFQSEARAAAALTHPNVVVVHDVGSSAGRHYLSMEFMERGNLESRLARVGKLPWREVLDVLHDAAAGLVYAELKGIVHRDIKPANLMQDGVGTTKIADLGLALHLEAEAQESDHKKIFGTPHFISPEQARGERVDARSDLYSLGATAYRLISGRTPFEGQTTRDILRGHFTEEPPALPKLVEDVPAELAGIIHRLLKKQPEERYPSAAELLKEVDRLRSQAEHGVSAGRSKAPLLVVGAVLVVIAGGVLFALTSGSGSGDREQPGGTTAANSDGGTTAPAATDGGATPGPGPGPGPEFVDREPTEDPGSKDDDTALAQMEMRAENAYLKIPSEFTPEERRAELVTLAQEFAGTAQAEQMAGEAERIGQQLAARATAAEERDGRVRAVLASLQRASETDGAVPAPGARMQRLLDVENQSDLAGDEAFQEQRRAIYQSTLAGAWSDVSEYVDAAEERARESGDFNALGEELNALLPGLELPTLPAELVPEDAEELKELRALAQRLPARVAGLDTEYARFEAQRRLDDSRSFAQALAGPAGLEDELRAWDLAAAKSRLEALSSQVHDDELRRPLGEWIAGLDAAQDALAAVTRELAAWRRKTVRDPRSKSSRFRDALAVDATGVTLEVNGNAERLAWSEFSAHPQAVSQLFLERLSRSYTPRELEGIAMLLRIATVAHTIDLAGPQLARTATVQFGPRAETDVMAAFDVLQPWDSSDLPAFEREREAARLVARSLGKASEGAWSSSVAATEMLLLEYDDTLLVRLLSDGTLMLDTALEELSPPVDGARGEPENAEETNPGADDQ